MESVAEEIDKELTEKNICEESRAGRDRSWGRFFAIRKLVSKDGASIVFAIVVFLISALISLVIVNAAMNNVLRLRRMKEERQAMLAISSAIPVVEGLFKGCTAYPAGEGASGYDVRFENSGLKDESMKSLQESFKSLVSNPSSGGENGIEWNLSVTGAGESKDMDLKLKLKMDPGTHDLSVEIEKTPKNDNAQQNSSSNTSGSGNTYSKTLNFPALEVKDEADNQVKVIEW